MKPVRTACPSASRWCSLALAAVLTLPAAWGQTVSERVLGRIELKGQPGPGIAVSSRGDQFARRESAPGGGERWVSLKGPGEVFDRLLPGAVWIEDRLVYMAERAGKTYLVDGARRTALAGKPTSPARAGRAWPSNDRRHYAIWVTEGKEIAWYLDGAKQARKFPRLGLVDIQPPASRLLFAAQADCQWQLIGDAASAALRWDQLNWVRATTDGSVVYTYGERTGQALLHRNGKAVSSRALVGFVASDDGQTWMAATDESGNGSSRLVLLRNGAQVDEAPVDATRHRLFLSADGSHWVWQLLDEDYIGSTFRSPGLPPRRVDDEVLEFHLSADGRRQALLTRSKTSPQRVGLEVDGITLPSLAGAASRSFSFGPGGAWALIAIDGASQSVLSHLGAGPAFEEVSRVLFLPDGRPAYVGSRGGARWAALGLAEVKLPADDIHHVDSLRVQGQVLRVLATRDTEVVDLGVQPH